VDNTIFDTMPPPQPGQQPEPTQVQEKPVPMPTGLRFQPKGADYWNELARRAAERAVIRARKLADYLLSDGYPPGTEPVRGK